VGVGEGGRGLGVQVGVIVRAKVVVGRATVEVGAGDENIEQAVKQNAAKRIKNRRISSYYSCR
jgi:hypothetical protein